MDTKMGLKKKKKKKLHGKKNKFAKFTKKSKKQSNLMKLAKMISDKNPQPVSVNPQMKYVQENTMRAVINLVTRPKEFVYSSGKRVPRGIAYHCHYTINFEEFFMTGAKHNQYSEFIYKVDRQSDISAYVSSNGKPQKLAVFPSITRPTSDDYQKGFMKRYFAKKVNEDGKPFEIAADSIAKSPLYSYTSVVWFISGTKQSVLEKNILSVAGAETQMKGVGKLLPEYQYFRNKDVADIQTRVKDLLGIPKEKVLKSVNNTVLPEEDTNKQQTTSNQAQGAGAATGPPPGVMTGGAGGGGY